MQTDAITLFLLAIQMAMCNQSTLVLLPQVALTLTLTPSHAAFGFQFRNFALDSIELITRVRLSA